MEPIRILHVLGTLNLGGAESRVMDLYRNIDHSKIQFDFLIHSEGIQHYEKEAESLGGKVYRLPRFKVYNYFSYKKAVKDFFKEHPEIKAVHGHMTSTAGIYLPLAKKQGIPMTIAHARSAGVDSGLKGKLTLFLRRNLKNKTDYCFTCSALAGEAVFGKKAMKEGRVQILPNAIEADKYSYNEEIRIKIRKELGIENQLVLGHVGRFSFMKNHKFILDIFEELVKIESNAILLFLGEGEYREEIRSLVKEKRWEEKVLFLGNKRNVSDYYQAMDFFIFPSIFEGLPGTVVEAQAAGLPCLISDTITKEVMITPLVRQLSLKQSPSVWAREVFSLLSKENKRDTKPLSLVKKSGFDVKAQVEKMTSFYQTAEKKKILLMVPMLHQGGFERVCVLTARLLEPYYQVFLCVFNLEDLAFDISGIPVFHLDLGVKEGKLGKVINVVKRCRKVRNLKKSLKINITYSFGPTANLVNVLSGTKKETGSSVWCGIRSYMDLDSSNHKTLSLFVKASDKVVSCSKLIENELSVGYNGKKIETLYNPYDEKSIKEQSLLNPGDLPYEKGQYFTLVSMGREDDVKGFWHLIKAFSLVLKKENEAKLIIIGDGSFKEYRKLAQDLGIEDRVIFTGMKRNPYPYLALGDIYLLTSFHEGFPNALVEAMSLGIPVIATDCKSGPREILCGNNLQEENKEQKDKKQDNDPWQEYGVLIPNMIPKKNLQAFHIDEDEKKLADYIMQLWKNKGKYEQYAKKAKERAGHFSFEAYTKQLRNMIEEEA